MEWLYCIAYFFGGAFFANVIPHLVAGTLGRSFQSPFAKPSGKGLSSPTTNVIWAWFNFVVGYLLIFHVGEFNPRSFIQAGALILGTLLLSLQHAHLFGKIYGNKGF